MYILINIDHDINKNILLKYLITSFIYKFIKCIKLLHFPSLFLIHIYILILITVIIVKIALKIAFLPIQLK